MIVIGYVFDMIFGEFDRVFCEVSEDCSDYWDVVECGFFFKVVVDVLYMKVELMWLDF